jgi:sulfur relay (sulfurtransferase) DsrC/TusE family protein
MSMKGLDDFLKNADKADEVPNVERNTARYEDFRISPEEWELCHLIKDFLLV